ncbi:HlyD family efflux transporter periplasmic adaptor subunit [Oceanimonas marisflavi]|uniref:HlyD family efflux transporter periplasmic adaptor subunit n=1 Tax=Oceanimonas marisflavi TaxID=2059724 RepID=UPI00130093C9|nr:HlyD family efflux transporter periplasmic adaptor subunit [Oceanimonas marisflavi]
MASPVWPELREELELHAGPAARDGSPTWSLFDPVRNLYFRIDWLTFEVLCRWQLADDDLIAHALCEETTLQITADTVADIARFLREHELVKCTSAGQSRALAEAAERHRTGWMTWLLHHYLFFRVPLWRPDSWLHHSLDAVRWLGSRAFALCTLLVLLLGLVEVSRQWDSFTATLVDLFSLKGLLAYGLTLVCVKFLHELGHAYTARHFGCRVPTMGIAFLVMFPMAYTDVNDAWRLPVRRQRLLVGAAGMLTELTIAAWATLAWALLPDGVLRNGAFLLATTTWISTLAINASPFLRFDGYFLLMDALELPNLHGRAFALARWQLREGLFALGDPPPETFSPGRRRFLLIFAWLVWLYRLVVFTGIAVLVYLTFPKPLGPLLAVVEIGWFIIRPVWREIQGWNRRRSDIMACKRIFVTTGLLLALVMLVALPWDSRVRTQALLQPAETFSLVAPGDGMLSELLAENGDALQAGQTIARFESAELALRLEAAEARLRGLAWRSNASSLRDELHQQQAVIRAAREQVQAELRGVREQQEQYRLRAPHEGILLWHHPDLEAGQWVGKNTRLGSIVSQHAWRVHAYLPEYELDRIRVGDKARFFADSERFSGIGLSVSRIDRDATRVLKEGMLASGRGGELLVREQGELLIPELALYRVTLKPDKAGQAALQQAGAVLPELRGRLVVQGLPRAWGWPYWRSLMAFIRREAGF